MLKNKSLRTRRFVAKYVNYIEVFGYLFVATLAAGIFGAVFYEVDDAVQQDKDPIIQPKETIVKENKAVYVNRLFVTEPYQQVRKGDPIVEVIDRPKWVERYKAVSHLRAALDEWNALEEKLAKEAEKKAKAEAAKAAAEPGAKDAKPDAKGTKPGEGDAAEAGKPKHQAKTPGAAEQAAEGAAPAEGTPKKKHKPKRREGAEEQQAAGDRPEGRHGPVKPARQQEKERPTRELARPRLARQPAEKTPAPPALETPPSTTEPTPSPAAAGEKPAVTTPAAPPLGEPPAPAASGEKPAPAVSGEKLGPTAPAEKPLATSPGEQAAPNAPAEKPARPAKGDRVAQAPSAEKSTSASTGEQRAKAHQRNRLAQAPAAEGEAPAAAGHKPPKARGPRQQADLGAAEKPAGAAGGASTGHPRGKKGEQHPHDEGVMAGGAGLATAPAGQDAAGEALAEAPPPSPLPKPDAKLKEAVVEALALWDEKAGDRAPKKVLTAPTDGVVVIKSTIENSVVDKNKEIAKVADFSHLQVQVKLKGENQPHVRIGQHAKIVVRAEQPPNRNFWGDREGLLWRAERVQFSDLIDDATKDWLRDEFQKRKVTRDDGNDIPLDVTDIDNIKLYVKLKTTPVTPQQMPAERDRLKPDSIPQMEFLGHVQTVKHSAKFALNELPPGVQPELEKKLLAQFQGKVIDDPRPFRIDGFRSFAVLMTVKAETDQVPKSDEERKKAIMGARQGAKVERVVDATIALDQPPSILTEAIKAQYERKKPTGPKVDVDVVTDRKRFAMLLFRQ
jgi:multidrug resistance efflux pump